MKAAHRRSNAISSPAATAFTEFVDQAFPTACSAYSSATIRSAGLAFCQRAHRRTMSWSIPTPIAALRCTRCARQLSRGSICNASHEEDIENWPDNRIWDELHKRLGGARKLDRRQGAAKGHHANAQFCGGADAVWAAISCRRQRAYRTADRCERHESRLCRRGGAFARIGCVLQEQK